MNSLYESQNRKITGINLLQIIKLYLKKNKENILIIDLDGCIINNLPRQQIILLKKLAKKLNIKEPSKEIKFQYRKYYNILDSINPDLIKDDSTRAEFLEYFLTNEYIHYDILIPGALTFINKVLDLGLKIIFLTGRHHVNENISMKSGTIKFLKSVGIDVNAPEIKLVMKNSLEKRDLESKIEFFEKIKKNPSLNIVGFIDNESKILNACSSVLDNSKLFRFNGSQSDDSEFSGILIDNWI